MLLGGITLTAFAVQTLALLVTKYGALLDSGTRRLAHPILACWTCMLQIVPRMTLDPKLATNSEPRLSTEPLLGRLPAAFIANATRQSVMVSSSSSAARARGAIALQSVNTSEASRCQLL